MPNLDTSTPVDSGFRSEGYAILVELKTALQHALRGGTTEGVEAIFPGASPSTAPVFHYRGLKGTTGELPSSGQYGLYFDSTRNTLQRDSGSAWEDVATMIPSGTAMIFFQESAPSGWTKSTDNDDCALRIVSGDGGGNGGTHGVSSPPSTAHVHTTQSHILTIAELPAHSHLLNWRYPVPPPGGDPPSQAHFSSSVDVDTGNTGGGQAHEHGDTGESLFTAFSPKYIDSIVCTKD